MQKDEIDKGRQADAIRITPEMIEAVEWEVAKLSCFSPALVAAVACQAMAEFLSRPAKVQPDVEQSSLQTSGGRASNL